MIQKSLYIIGSRSNDYKGDNTMDLYEIGALPIGFSMQLSQDLKAMEHFAAMSLAQKEELIAYIQGGSTGEEAEQRVHEAIMRLQ